MWCLNVKHLSLLKPIFTERVETFKSHVSVEQELIPYQCQFQDFPEGGANSQSGCADLFVWPKTAWKLKNLDPRGGVPGAPWIRYWTFSGSYPEIGDVNYKCALWIFKQQLALKCELWYFYCFSVNVFSGYAKTLDKHQESFPQQFVLLSWTSWFQYGLAAPYVASISKTFVWKNL